jgi:hypothetical protein
MPIGRLELLEKNSQTYTYPGVGPPAIRVKSHFRSSRNMMAGNALYTLGLS